MSKHICQNTSPAIEIQPFSSGRNSEWMKYLALYHYVDKIHAEPSQLSQVTSASQGVTMDASFIEGS